MTDKKLMIGRLAKLSGVPAKTIRFYEESGILPSPDRSESGYRLYSDIDVRRLELIRGARLLDMALPEVSELLQWADSATCNDFQGRFLGVVRRKLKEVDQRITDLRQLEQNLLHMEAHFDNAGKEIEADHTMLECSPDTCRCLGDANENRGQQKESMTWLQTPEFRR